MPFTEESINTLRLLVGESIWLVRRKRTRRGNEVVDFVKIANDNVVSLSGQIAELLRLRYDQEHGGIELRGSNAAHVVTALSNALFGNPNQLSAEWI